MANLKEIRIRIGSVSSTMQITSAMKMVSAAKLKKAQDAITAMRPYSNKLLELMQRFSGASGTGEKSFTNKRKIKKVLVIAISSNRGLCGAFNTNIAKEINIIKSRDEFKNSEIDFLPSTTKALFRSLNFLCFRLLINFISFLLTIFKDVFLTIILFCESYFNKNTIIYIPKPIIYWV